MDGKLSTLILIQIIYEVSFPCDLYAT